MQAVLNAITHPARRQILALLESGEWTAGDLAAQFTISRPAVSRHLRVLHAAGLVHSRRRAQQRVFCLDTSPLAGVDAWLATYRPYRSEWIVPLGPDVRNRRP